MDRVVSDRLVEGGGTDRATDTVTEGRVGCPGTLTGIGVGKVGYGT